MATETDISNMSLGLLGAKRIADFDTTNSEEAIQCRLQYPQVRDSLLRSHEWRFAISRAILVVDTQTPAFEWNYQYNLPKDFLRLRSVWSDSGILNEKQISGDTTSSYAIEGNKLFSNDSTVYLRYIRYVDDTSEFDPLFTDVLVLALAVRLANTLAGVNVAQLKQPLTQELNNAMSIARRVSFLEQDQYGKEDYPTYNNARWSGGTIITGTSG